MHHAQYFEDGDEMDVDEMYEDLDLELASNEHEDDVRFPDIEVTLVGADGNAFAILGRVQEAMRRGGIDKEQRDAFMNEATRGNYDHLLQTVMRWVTVH
jgi:hypothetical protein